MLLAGTGPGEYVTNGAAAGPVVAAGKGTPREEESGEMSLTPGGLSTSRSQRAYDLKLEFDGILSRDRSEPEIPPSLQTSTTSVVSWRARVRYFEERKKPFLYLLRAHNKAA